MAGLEEKLREVSVATIGEKRGVGTPTILYLFFLAFLKTMGWGGANSPHLVVDFDPHVDEGLMPKKKKKIIRKRNGRGNQHSYPSRYDYKGPHSMKEYLMHYDNKDGSDIPYHIR